MPTRVYDDFGDITRRLHNWSMGDFAESSRLAQAQELRFNEATAGSDSGGKTLAWQVMSNA